MVDVITRGFMCGRGRGGAVSTSVWSATCDHEACTAKVTAFGADQYAAAAAIGWRRHPTLDDGALCPEHSGAQLQLDDGLAAS